MKDCDQLTRRDVDELAAKILIHFGLINTGAIAACLADVTELSDCTPFAIGLIAAIFSQTIWLFDAVIEHALDGKSAFSRRWEQATASVVSTLLIYSAGVLSGFCIVYGCFLILKFSSSDAIFYSVLLCVYPTILMFYIAFRGAYNRAKKGF